ncbi:unnamed protein product [Closterium sp. Naga37s-1]|nr:unnamed protein product [Closterium sp. Naga37s-1]
MRREAVNSSATGGGSFPLRMVFTKACRWVQTNALAVDVPAAPLVAPPASVCLGPDPPALVVVPDPLAPVGAPCVPAVPALPLAAVAPAAPIPAGAPAAPNPAVGSSPQAVSATTGGPGPGESGGAVAPIVHRLVSMADLQRVVSVAVREERNGQASESNSPRGVPAHAFPPLVVAPPSAIPLPRSDVPPPLAPATSAAAPGNRMRLPWIPPVAGIEFVTAAGGPVTAQNPSLLPGGRAHSAAAPPVQTLVGPLPSAEVPEASLGQLRRLPEGLRAVHLIQVYGHAALSNGVSLDGGRRDECLDAADRLAELLAPV